MKINTCDYACYLHIVLLDGHAYSCVHCSPIVKAFSRLHMGAMCTNMNTHTHTRRNVGKEMGVGRHVDLDVDVDVGASSSLLSFGFLLCFRNVMLMLASSGSLRKHFTFHDVPHCLTTWSSNMEPCRLLETRTAPRSKKRH